MDKEKTAVSTLPDEDVNAILAKAAEILKAEREGKVAPAGDVERKAPDGVAAVDKAKAAEREPAVTFGAPTIVHADTKRDLKEFSIGKMVRGVAGYGWKDAGLEKEYHQHMKSVLEIEDDTLGGFLVPEEWRQNEISPLLKEMSTFRAAGAQVISNAPATLYMPRQSGASSFSWVGMGAQSADVSGTNPTLAMDAWRLRRAVGAVLLDEAFLKFSVQAADGFIRNDLVTQWAETEDAAFWGGTGDAQPDGMRYNVLYRDGGSYTTNVAGSIAASHLMTLRTTFRARKVTRPNVLMMSPTTWGYVIDEQTGIGTYKLVSDMTKAPEEAVLGFKIVQNSLFDNGEILSGDFSQFVITEQPIEIDVFRETKALSCQVVVRAVTYVDGKPRRPESFQRLYGISG